MPACQDMSRPAGYRYGSWLALHGSGAHLVGFSTSCWLSRDSNHTMGLWASCRDTRCSRLSADDVPGWFLASRVLSSVGVMLLTLWLMAGCQCKCLRSRQQRHKWLLRLEELLAISSGCVALFSVGIFATGSARDSILTHFSLGWSLWLVVGGASACTVGGVIVAGTRNSTHLAPKPCTRSIRPLNSPTVVGTSEQAESQEPRWTRGEPRRHEDVTDIFNVVSYTRNPNGGGSLNSGFRTPHSRLVELVGPPPPPYWASGEPPGPDAGMDSLRHNVHSGEASSPMYELSLSPPPSYEMAMNERPPPYEPRPDHPRVQPEGTQ